MASPGVVEPAYLLKRFFVLGAGGVCSCAVWLVWNCGRAVCCWGCCDCASLAGGFGVVACCPLGWGARAAQTACSRRRCCENLPQLFGIEFGMARRGDPIFVGHDIGVRFVREF